MSDFKGTLHLVKPERIRFADKKATSENTFRNARTTLNKEEMGTLRESIRTIGILKPPVLRPIQGDADFDFEMLAGSRRLRSVLKLKEDNTECFCPASSQMKPAQELYESIPCFVRDCDDDTAIRISMAENLEHSAVPDLDLMEWCEELVEIKNPDKSPRYTREQIAELCNRSESWVSLTLKLRNLSAPYKKLMLDQRLSRTAALNMMLGCEEDKYDEVLEKAEAIIKEEADIDEKKAAAELREARLDVAEAEADAAIYEQRQETDAVEAAKKRLAVGHKRVSVASEKRASARKKGEDGHITADTMSRAIRETVGKSPDAKKGKLKALSPKNMKALYDTFNKAENNECDPLVVSVTKGILDVCLGRRICADLYELIKEEEGKLVTTEG